MVHGRRNVDPELLDMVRKLATSVEAIELAQNHGRHLHDVGSISTNKEGGCKGKTNETFSFLDEKIRNSTIPFS